MRYGLITFLFFILLMACSPSKIQPKKTTVLDPYSKQAYLSDFHQLVSELKRNHPKMYQFISEESFDAFVVEAEAQISDDMNRGAFLWLCRSVAAKIGCGHTSVPTLYNKFFVPDSLIFSVYAQFINDRLYVLDPLVNKEKLAVGAEILKINDINVSELKKNISEHLSADAYIQSFLDANINRDFMFYCAYQLNFPPKYTITYSFEGVEQVIDLEPLYNYSSLQSIWNKDNDALAFSIMEADRIAVIRIGSFVYYNDRLSEFKNFIDESFTKLRNDKIEHLIIDLRENGGGDPYAASYLLQHLSNKPFKYYKKGNTKYYKDLENELSPSSMYFDGEIYILVDGIGFSTTGHLMSLIKTMNISTIIGQEIGATYSCNANTVEVILNNTFISAYIARKTYQTVVTELPLDRGVLPDFTVENDLDALLLKKDRVMDFTLNLIQE